MVDDKELVRLLQKELLANKKTIAKQKKSIKEKTEEIAALKADIETLRESFKIVHGHIVWQVHYSLDMLAVGGKLTLLSLPILIEGNIEILAGIDAHRIKWPKKGN